MGLDNPIHIAFVLLVVLLVFGAKRLPELGRSLGGGMRGFKEALSGEHRAIGEGDEVRSAGGSPELAAAGTSVPAVLDAHERRAA